MLFITQFTRNFKSGLHFFTHIGPTMRAHINRLGPKKWVLKYLCLYVKAPTLCQCYVEPELAQKLLDQFCSNSPKTYKISQKDNQNVNFLKFENQTIFSQNFLFSRSSVYFMNTRLWAFFCKPQIAKLGFEVKLPHQNVQFDMRTKEIGSRVKAVHETDQTEYKDIRPRLSFVYIDWTSTLY